MSTATLETPHWTGRRWFTTLFMVMVGQVALIFWLARHRPAFARTAPASSAIFIANGDVLDRFALLNPAQFALANRGGFSGGAWMKPVVLDYDSPEWTEPPRPLSLAVDKLPSGLHEHAQENLVNAFEPAFTPEPQLESIAPLPDLPATSTVTVEGELAGRPLISIGKLDAIAAPEILTNSVVQVAVNRDGTVFSAVLADGPKESKEGKLADASAVSFAKAARFQRLPRDFEHRDLSDSELQWGRLVFHWRTIPPPATNATAANP